MPETEPPRRMPAPPDAAAALDAFLGRLASAVVDELVVAGPPTPTAPKPGGPAEEHRF